MSDNWEIRVKRSQIPIMWEEAPKSMIQSPLSREASKACVPEVITWEVVAVDWVAHIWRNWLYWTWRMVTVWEDNPDDEESRIDNSDDTRYVKGGHPNLSQHLSDVWLLQPQWSHLRPSQPRPRVPRVSHPLVDAAIAIWFETAEAAEEPVETRKTREKVD